MFAKLFTGDHLQTLSHMYWNVEELVGMAMQQMHCYFGVDRILGRMTSAKIWNATAVVKIRAEEKC